MTSPSLSLIIVHFNTRELLRQCLLSIARFCPEAQVIVVDNASRDGSSAVVRAEFPAVVLIESATNLGFAGANNRGLAVATGDFQVLLNSDTILEDDTLSRCARWMQADPTLGAAAPRLIGVDDRPQPSQLRFMSLRGELAIMLRRPRRPLSGDRDPESWLPGTALMIRREALAGVGGRLDEAFFMYGEDADLSMRLRKAGWDLAVFADGQIRHYGGASGGGSDSQRRLDLQAWSFYARYRWARHHMGFFAFAALWGLDALDVGRLMLRGLYHRDLKSFAPYARVKAQSLAYALVGRRPHPPVPRPALVTPGTPPDPDTSTPLAVHCPGPPSEKPT